MPAKPSRLSNLPAADLAAERKQRLAVLDRIELRLDHAVPGWRNTYVDAAVALVDALGGSVGEPTPADVSDEAHEAAANADESRLRACEVSLAEALDLGAGCNHEWTDLLRDVRENRLALDRANAAAGKATEREQADAVTSIDNTTPEGVLALLDAAADASLRLDDRPGALEIQAARDVLADYHDLPLRDPAAHRTRLRDYAAKIPRPPSDIERQAATLSAHDSGVLALLLLADAHDLPAVGRAALAGRGQGEVAAVERIAATATALAWKWRGGK